MPLARFAMHEQGEIIHVAQWPAVKEIHQIASRHYAFEGACFVLAAGCTLKKRDLLKLDLPMFDYIPGEDDSFLLDGGSCIIAPDGAYLAEPLMNQEGFVSAQIEPDLVIERRLTLDVTGHYSRPDIFQLTVDTRPQKNVDWQ